MQKDKYGNRSGVCVTEKSIHKELKGIKKERNGKVTYLKEHSCEMVDWGEQLEQEIETELSRIPQSKKRYEAMNWEWGLSTNQIRA